MYRYLVALSVWLLIPAFICNADLVPATPSGVLPSQSPPSLPTQDVPNTIELAPIKIKPHRIIGVENDTQGSSKYAGFLSYVSPEYKMNKKVFLVKSSITRSKRAFMFVFLMNNRKKDEPARQRKRVHIPWTASKKMFRDHKVIENEYPVDVTVAPYKDGFAPGEWNLILPNKKPKEVQVAFLWTF